MAENEINLAVNEIPVNIGSTENVYLGVPKRALPSNIPLPNKFVGRKRELEGFRKAMLEGKTLFVLHGIAGIGKTQIALRFISEIKNKFEAHIQVDLRVAGFPKDAMLEVIKAFDPLISSALREEEIRDLYLGFLNEYKTLLFFDDVCDVGQIEKLIDPRALIVIVSRKKLDIEGASTWKIEPMSSKDAIALLYSVTDKKQVGRDAKVLVDLAGHNPLALRTLAGLLAEIGGLKREELIKEFTYRKEHLKFAPLENRNLSIEAGFDLEYEHLNEEIKRCWRKLAIFPGDFDLDAIKAIWQNNSPEDTCSELLKKHLLNLDEKSGRFSLHDLACSYAFGKLNGPELYETERLFITHYGIVLRGLTELNSTNLLKFEIERVNFEKGFSYIEEKLKGEPAFASLCLLYTGYAIEILRFKLDPFEFIKWMKAGILSCRELEYLEGEINQLLNLAITYRNMGEYKESIEYFEQALILAEKMGDTPQQVSILGRLGNSYSSLGQYDKAIDLYERSLKITREIKDPTGEDSILGSLGNIYSSLGEYEKAIDYYEKALKISGKIGNRLSEGSIKGNLGTIYHSLGEYRKALTYYEQALPISREIGNKSSEGTIIGNLGTIYHSLGKYPRAIEYYEQALQISKDTADRQSEGVWLGNIGKTYLSLGKKETAEDFTSRAIKVFESIKSPNAKTVKNLLTDL